MNRFSRLLVLVCVLSALFLGWVLPVHAAEPPQLLKADSQVVLQSDGALDIKYRLTFREVDVRSGITTIGPLDAGHTIREATIEEGGVTRVVKLRSQGGNLYGVDFGFSTEPGRDYTVLVHYSAPARLDQTTYKGEAYRVFAWAPIQWALPIEEQIVTFILPIELPSSVTQPEQVTDDVVNATGVVANSSVVARFDRWIYYPTPDETAGKVWLSLYISSKNLSPQANFTPSFYIPERHLTLAPAGAQETAPGGVVATPEPEKPTLEDLAITGVCFGCPGLAIIALIGFLAFRWTRPKQPKPVYQAPAIEIETFEQPGTVPDLSMIEAALYIGDTTKVITLILMQLVDRDVVAVLNHKPLQLEVHTPDAPLEDYERALIDGIADDGTLSQSAVDHVLQLLTARLQSKLWNADSQATRQAYQQKADDALSEWQRMLGEDTTTRPVIMTDPLWGWSMLSRHYRPIAVPSEAIGKSAPGKASGDSRSLWDSVRESTPVRTAGMMAGLMEGVAGDLARKAEGLAASAAQVVDQITGKAPAGYDACHSACHSACVHDACHSACVHDACHSACHSACVHDACHSACHSACVSKF